jgi:hypothetical protein
VVVKIRQGSNESQFTGGGVIIGKAFSDQRSAIDSGVVCRGAACCAPTPWDR